MENYELNAAARSTKGKGSSRQLRMNGKIPGIFYLRGQSSISLTIEQKDLLLLMKENPSLVQLNLEGQESRECIIRELQKDPVTEAVVHIDFMGIKRGQKIKVAVPIRLKGTPIGVKNSGGILQHVTTEVDIECLPKDIPQRITLSVDNLEIGDTIVVSDLDFPEFKFFTELRTVIATVIEPVISKDILPGDEEAEDEEAGEGEDKEAAE